MAAINTAVMTSLHVYAFLHRCIVKNSTALIHLEVSRPICVETYEDCKGLGRFMLRYSGNTIATGIITKVNNHFCVAL